MITLGYTLVALLALFLLLIVVYMIGRMFWAGVMRSFLEGLYQVEDRKRIQDEEKQKKGEEADEGQR